MSKNNYGEAIRLLAKLPTENLIIMRDMCYEVAAQGPAVFIKAYTKIMNPIEGKIEIPGCGSIFIAQQKEISQLAFEGRRIQAIKLLRDFTHCELRGAKNYVDGLKVGGSI